MAVGELLSGWVVVPQVRAMHETVYGVKTHFMYGGDGEPVVLVHGGGCAATSWNRTIPALAPHFRAYAPDSIGYGYSDKPRIDYSFQMQVEHLAGFIDALNLKRLRLIGFSQGAYVAIKYALDHPGRVQQAALIGSGTLATALGIQRPPGPRPPHFEGTKESMRRAMQVLINDPLMITDEILETRMTMAALPGRKESQESIGRYRETVTHDPDQWQVYDVRSRLPQLTVPWCLIWGSADVSAPLEPLGLTIHAMFPQVPFFVVEGSGHQVQSDQPAECNRLILEFFGVPTAASAAV